MAMATSESTRLARIRRAYIAHFRVPERPSVGRIVELSTIRRLVALCPFWAGTGPIGLDAADPYLIPDPHRTHNTAPLAPHPQNWK